MGTISVPSHKELSLQSKVMLSIDYQQLFLILKESLDTIEKLLEKQTAFEKLLSTQEERFIQLENLTTVSLFMLCSSNCSFHFVVIAVILPIGYSSCATLKSSHCCKGTVSHRPAAH